MRRIGSSSATASRTATAGRYRLAGDHRPRPHRVGQGRTRMSIEIVFPSAEAMEQILAMGTDEGLTQAVIQIDAIVAEDAVVRH
jgi:hypothetical protein